MPDGDVTITRVVVEGRPVANSGGDNFRRARWMLLRAFADNRWPGTSPPSDETRPPSKSAVTFLRCTAERSNGRRVSSVMAGVALSLPGKKTLDNEFLLDVNDLRYVCHHSIGSRRTKRASRMCRFGGGASMSWPVTHPEDSCEEFVEQARLRIEKELLGAPATCKTFV